MVICDTPHLGCPTYGVLHVFGAISKLLSNAPTYSLNKHTCARASHREHKLEIVLGCTAIPQQPTRHIPLILLPIVQPSPPHHPLTLLSILHDHIISPFQICLPAQIMCSMMYMYVYTPHAQVTQPRFPRSTTRWVLSRPFSQSSPQCGNFINNLKPPCQLQLKLTNIQILW